MSDGRTAAVLTLDRGNSTLDCMLWDRTPDRIPRRVRLDPGDMAGLRRFLAAGCPPRAAGLTVVRDGLEPVRSLLQEHGADLRLVGSDLEVPLRVVYEAPGTLGPDRLVAALAAHLRHGRGVVADLGTAVSVSCVRDGVFLGGAIAPGPLALARGLAGAAPALPQVDLAAPIRLPAESALDAVNAGVGVGFAGLVQGLVTAAAAAADLGDAPHLLTGGQAERYLAAVRVLPRSGAQPSFEHVPDLVHQGLRWLADRA